MSNRDPDTDYSRAIPSVRFALRQFKKTLHTALPGKVLAYDAATRRAQVQIAVNLLLTEGRGSLPRPTVVDVPYVGSFAGGWAVHAPLKADDAVWVEFSERGIERFKETYDVADPPDDSVLQERDAVVTGGFGTLDGFSPASRTGLAIQSEDGEVHVLLEEDRIQVRKGDQYITLTDDLLEADVQGNVAVVASGKAVVQASEIVLDAPTVHVPGNLKVGGNLDVGGNAKNRGQDIGATHRHSAVQSGGSQSGPPA